MIGMVMNVGDIPFLVVIWFGSPKPQGLLMRGRRMMCHFHFQMHSPIEANRFTSKVIEPSTYLCTMLDHVLRISSYFTVYVLVGVEWDAQS